MTPPDQHAATAPPPIFVARGLTKIYPMGEVQVQALRGVDLDLYAGELVVLLGPSGSGKSTLLNILGGLDTPTSGSVRYEDHDLSLDDDASMTHYRRSHIGFVFQFYNLIPSLTARENVALVTEIADNPMTQEEALALVGLGQRMDHFPTQMSGGEQQRVAIARVNRKLGTTTVVITHNAVIAAMADRVVYFGDGLVARIERNAQKKAASELNW